MKRKTYKKLSKMAQKIKGVCWTVACLLTLAVMVAPCLLIFSVGDEGELTVWNFVGLVWMLGLFVAFKIKSR